MGQDVNSAPRLFRWLYLLHPPPWKTTKPHFADPPIAVKVARGYIMAIRPADMDEMKPPPDLTQREGIQVLTDRSPT